MNLRNASATCVVLAGVTIASLGAQAPAPSLQAAADQIVKSDAAFAQSVAEKNREKFLSFIAEATTFGGGTANELHGRDAVMKGWGDFFTPNGPTLSWTKRVEFVEKRGSVSGWEPHGFISPLSYVAAM